MKKLFLKNGSHILVTVSTEKEGKYISIYEEPYGINPQDKKHTLKYSIFSGVSATRQMLILADGVTELPLWEVSLITEIYENFSQYFNNLNQ